MVVDMKHSESAGQENHKFERHMDNLATYGDCLKMFLKSSALACCKGPGFNPQHWKKKYIKQLLYYVWKWNECNSLLLFYLEVVF